LDKELFYRLTWYCRVCYLY